MEVRAERRQALAIRWLIKAARDRSETTMIGRLSGELLDASNNRGEAVKMRENSHRMLKLIAHFHIIAGDIQISNRIYNYGSQT